jgi:hypothetical protein
LGFYHLPGLTATGREFSIVTEGARGIVAGNTGPKLIHPMVANRPTIASAAMPAMLKSTSFGPSMLHTAGFKDRAVSDVDIAICGPFVLLVSGTWSGGSGPALSISLVVVSCRFGIASHEACIVAKMET